MKGYTHRRVVAEELNEGLFFLLFFSFSGGPFPSSNGWLVAGNNNSNNERPKKPRKPPFLFRFREGFLSTIGHPVFVIV